MKKTKRLITLSLTTIFIGSLHSMAWADTNQDEDEQYTILDVYTLAKDNNATYQSSRYQFQAASENPPIALGSLLPNISASYQAEYRQTDDSTSHEQTPGATINQVLFDWSTWQTYSASKKQTKAAAMVFAQAQQDLIMKTIRAYFAVLRDQDNLGFAKAAEKWNKQLLSQTEKKYKVGLNALNDVEATRAQYKQAVAERLKAKQQLASSYADLQALTGQKIDHIEHLSADYPFGPPQPNDIKKWVDIALAHNLVVARDTFSLEAKQAGVQIEWGKFLPSAQASASINYRSNTNNNPFQHGNEQESFQASATWNLFNGGSDYASVQQKRYDAKSMAFQVKQDKRDAQRDVRTNFLNVLSVESQVKAFEQSVIASEASVKAMRAGFEVGTQTIVDLLNQQKQLFESQRNYSQAVFNYIIDQAQLKASAGILSYQDIDDINQWLTQNVEDSVYIQPDIGQSQNS